MHSLLSIQQRQAFEAQGYLLVRQVLNFATNDTAKNSRILISSNRYNHHFFNIRFSAFTIPPKRYPPTTRA